MAFDAALSGPSARGSSSRPGANELHPRGRRYTPKPAKSQTEKVSIRELARAATVLRRVLARTFVGMDAGFSALISSLVRLTTRR
jgi:hypothetical protein